jgi:hypothetical protein
MNASMVNIRELSAWGLDDYEYRPKVSTAKQLEEASHRVKSRPTFEQSNVLLETPETTLINLLASHADRPDLLAEMSGLSWSLGIVDLRSLVAFQRRLSFRTDSIPVTLPAERDWPALVQLAFGARKPIKYEYELTHDRSTRTLILRSSNPNLHIATTNEAAFPLSIRTSGPFFEVACFRDRWFLRDGYHRAYALLRAGVYEVPAVIVKTSTMEELGACQPWFFSEEILFSDNPPRLVDFLEDDLVLEYTRPALIKTMRITMEETLAPATSTGEQS